MSATTARTPIPRCQPLEPASAQAAPAHSPLSLEAGRQANASPAALVLDVPPALVEQIAQRAAELIADRQPMALESLLTVAELAEHLHVAPDWVRRHQATLGALRLTDGGGRNPIRFKPSDVDKFLIERRLTPPTRAGNGGWRDDPDWASG
jgi:hypothetical protein